MDNPQKILIIQLKRAGDVILTTPIAALLKRRWPQAQVDFLVEKAFAPLLENNPSIDRVQVYDKQRILRTLRRIRAERYDQIFDFQSSPRSAIVVLTSGAQSSSGYAVPFWGRVYRNTIRRPGGTLTVIQGKVSLVELVAGPLTNIPEAEIYLTKMERDWAQNSQENVHGRKVIGLVPTHRRASRRWHAESFAALARAFDQAGYAVWLFWGPGERDYVEKVQQQAPESWVVPPTSLRQMAALLSCCDLVVSNDNGPMHLATAVGTPTVTVYGPTDPHAWNPGGSRHIALQASGVSCLGCNLNDCPFNHECMTQLTPEQVFAASQQLLSRTSGAVLV